MMTLKASYVKTYGLGFIINLSFEKNWCNTHRVRFLRQEEEQKSFLGVEKILITKFQSISILWAPNPIVY